jgi:hypothetical protein
LSTAVGGKFAGDIHVYVEVKARSEFSTRHTWLVQTDLLLLKGKRQPPLPVLSRTILARLVAPGARL